MSALAERWTLDKDRFFWMYNAGDRAPRRVELDNTTGFWNVHSYAAALYVLNNPDIFSSGTSRLMGEVDDSTITQIDPPRHTAMRKLVTRAFTARATTRLEPRTRAIVNDLLAKVADRKNFDLVAELAYPLPITVIAELLGVPVSDYGLIKGWVDAMLSGTMEFSLVNRDNELQSELEYVLEQARHIEDYIRELSRQRRVKPGNDLLTGLVQAEVDGERLTEKEVTSFANALLVAGHVTTTLLIGSTMLCLDAYPQINRAVREDRDLIPALLEESLRYFPPISSTVRLTNAQVELEGATIGPDQLVQVWIPAANRDGQVFADGHEFQLARDPNPHLAFGHGAHFCIGAALARQEARIAINTLLDVFPELRCDPENPPAFMTSPNLNGVTSLPVLVS
jgi:cytochrome P450